MTVDQLVRKVRAKSTYVGDPKIMERAIGTALAELGLRVDEATGEISGTVKPPEPYQPLKQTSAVYEGMPGSRSNRRG